MKRLEVIGEGINNVRNLLLESLSKTPVLKESLELQERHFNRVAKKAQTSTPLELARNLRDKNWKDLTFGIIIPAVSAATALVPPYVEIISSSFTRIPSLGPSTALGVVVALSGLHASFIFNQDKKIIIEEATDRNLPVKRLLGRSKFPFIPRQAINQNPAPLS